MLVLIQICHNSLYCTIPQNLHMSWLSPLPTVAVFFYPLTFARKNPILHLQVLTHLQSRLALL